MINNTWITSDSHFCHSNIIKYCNRPFKDQYEMNEALTINWNSNVKPNDVVYHLGDVGFFRDVNHLDDFMKNLNGRIHLILGNHDKKWIYKSKRFETIQSDYIGKINDKPFHLYHYPLMSWNAHLYGAIHCFGHVHGQLDSKLLPNSMDVGVDSWNFTPLNIDFVIETLNKD